MTNPITSAAILYAKNLQTLSAFYAAVASLSVREVHADHVVLEARRFELSVVAIPPHLAADIAIQSPPLRREDTPIKLAFFVDSLDAASAKVAELGGQMNPAERMWRFRGASVLDGHDPEGNVFQLRQESAVSTPFPL